ncbi:MAG: hypothetical protein IT422_03115 [Pirellulaceae bacterium]|nr:hypothetical protein [Pirellulaceae bacterium]
MLTPRDRIEIAAEVAKQVIAMLDARGGKPALVDAHGLANALGVSTSTVDRWIADGLVPVKVRLGNVRRFALTEVIDALSRVKEAEAETGACATTGTAAAEADN